MTPAFLNAAIEVVANRIVPLPVLNFYAHRSGQETWQYCPRRRYLAYHHLGTGINVFPPLYFEIGTVVHAGLAYILDASKLIKIATDLLNPLICQEAVDLSINIFQGNIVWQGMRPDDRSEQETLIAGLLWTFWYRVWPQFISKFEVLMTEPPSVDTREFSVTRKVTANGSFQPLADYSGSWEDVPARLHLLSRPDAIVRDRQTGEVVAINWKTINSVTDERRNNITASLQVALESHYAEQLYSKWMDEEFVPDIPEGLRGKQLMQYLDETSTYYKSLPREVAYTQIVYLVKGARQLLTASGEEMTAEQASHVNEELFWRQDSFLCYRYVDLSAGLGKPGSRTKPFGAVARPETSWAFRFYKEGNASYNQLPAEYARQGIWQAEGLTIQDHVQQLNAGKVFPSTWNVDDERNEANPLDRIVLFENPIYRDVEMQTRLRRSTITKEMDIAQALVRVEERTAAGEALTDVLDEEFEMRLISCRRGPTRCEFDGKICNVPQEGRQELFTILPAGSIWNQRVPHHAAELEAFKNAC